VEHLTLVAAYYNQPQIMREHWANLLEYEDEVREHVSIVLCDDASMEHPLEIPTEIQQVFNVQQFKLLGDVAWREMVARNVCMKHAKGWCFMFDPDYMLVPGMMKRLLNKDLQRGHYYHLASRVYSDKRKLHMPENLAVVHRDDFWASGGYDEQFAGGYGFSDCILFKMLRDGMGFQDVHLLDVFMDHYPKGSFPSLHGLGTITDAASPSKRDTRRNKPLFENVLTFIRRNGIRHYLQHLKAQESKFKWERVL
jgi:hypothetical protein